MSISTLIIGESGTGKTASMRNLDPSKTLLIQTISKPLPFKSADWKRWDKEKGTGSILVLNNAQHIQMAINSAKDMGKEIVIIDDFQYQMASNFMASAMEKGFDKFNVLAKDIWDICTTAINADDDLRIYFLTHSQSDDFGHTKMKTLGKLLDDKVTMEGLFTTVLRTNVNDGNYTFLTHNSGNDTVKSPMGLFEENEIDNDLSIIDNAICEYYGIKPTTKEQ